MRGAVAGSVIYRMHATERSPDQSRLSYLQQVALKDKLPLAVVFCYEPAQQPTGHGEVFAALREAEATLAANNIPLMVLIGDPAERFKWFSQYVQPRVVGDCDMSLPATSGGRVGVHPHVWPGVVMSIDQLETLIEQDQLTC